MKIGDRVEVRPSNAYKTCPLVGTIDEIDTDYESIDGHPCYIVRIDTPPHPRLRSYVPRIRLIDAVTQLGDVAREATTPNCIMRTRLRSWGGLRQIRPRDTSPGRTYPGGRYGVDAN